MKSIIKLLSEQSNPKGLQVNLMTSKSNVQK